MGTGADSFEGTDRFVLQRKLGEGAFGVVYEAEDVDRGERVALKTLQNAAPAALYRFKREFRELSDIVHPNLVGLYELQQEGPHWFFTMEFIEGTDFLTDLRLRVRPDTVDGGDNEIAAAETLDLHPTSPTSPADTRIEDVVHQFRALAEAIHALHQHGKVHRDLKPGNVRVEQGTDRVVLLDFGLVTEVTEDSNASIGVKGTPAYMAPEQAAGKQATPASDWYAFGVMLFEALTGQTPFSPRKRVLF